MDEYNSIEDFQEILLNELRSLEGIHAQDTETGSKNIKSTIGTYTNKLFGAPFQLLDSVDKRFNTVNSHVGSEYLRNFLLHSPILHIRPGLPQYTGGEDVNSVTSYLREMYISDADVGADSAKFILQKAVFNAGSKLQRRMFGLKPTYIEYMMYVNYMCRSIAVLMGITESDKELKTDTNLKHNIPHGTFVTDMKFASFGTIRWENYRMNNNSYVDTSIEHLQRLINTGYAGVVNTAIASSVDYITPWGDNFLSGDKVTESIMESWNVSLNTNIKDTVADRIRSVMFMVEPVSFTENLTNDTSQSFIENAIDTVSHGVGAEVAFITGSNSDVGIIEGLTSFLGNGVENASMSMAKLVEPVTGGFVTNLFSGALQSIKGQKMIYPDIYKASKSRMDYDYSITLSTPYGDPYNYYINILVPLMHLIALVSPRMITSNTTASPFLVQSYIPGMCTCQMGIVSNMTIIKNPNYNGVSVQGFPLTIKVTFQIQELYNAMAISPAHDPASFMFNETLNDYLANLSGLIPSMDTFSRQRANIFQNLTEYFDSKLWAESVVTYTTESAQDSVFKNKI